MIKNVKIMVSNIFMDKVDEKHSIDLKMVLDEMGRFGVNDVEDIIRIDYSRVIKMLNITYKSNEEVI